MKPFEKILVPIDFGQHSTEAMRRAVDVAGHYGASLTLVYVYEPLDYALPEGYALYTPEQVGQLLDDFRERLRSAAREVQGMGVSSVAHDRRACIAHGTLSRAHGEGGRASRARRRRPRQWQGGLTTAHLPEPRVASTRYAPCLCLRS
jgi:hypothetical protein